jgi:hypothetical protein
VGHQDLVLLVDARRQARLQPFENAWTIIVIRSCELGQHVGYRGPLLTSPLAPRGELHP